MASTTIGAAHRRCRCRYRARLPLLGTTRLRTTRLGTRRLSVVYSVMLLAVMVMLQFRRIKNPSSRLRILRLLLMTKRRSIGGYYLMIDSVDTQNYLVCCATHPTSAIKC